MYVDKLLDFGAIKTALGDVDATFFIFLLPMFLIIVQ